MKKKLLALLLCMTICIVGMPFSMNAAEYTGSVIHDFLSVQMERRYEICDCGVNYVLVNYSPTYEIVTYYSTADKCCERLYPAVRAQCPECGVLTTVYDVYETIYTHNYALNGQCTVCGYWRASK